VHFLHADRGFPARTGAPGAIWAGWAPDLGVSSCVSGHFAMEESPEAVLAAFVPFFADAR
jgi:haloacetate dehalogenase